MFIGGFGLFSLGVADDPDASPIEIAIVIAFVVLNFLAWYYIWQGIGALMRARARKFVTPRCADSRSPVSASTGARFVKLDFTNENYAMGVAQMNGLQVEPIPFVIPIVGDMLAQIQP